MKSLSSTASAALRRAVFNPLRTQRATNCTVIRASTTRLAHGRHGSAVQSMRSFHAPAALRGLMPDAENPAPREPEDADQPTVPTDISTTEFHERADAYLEELVGRLEEKQEQTPDVEVEYSVREPH
jgi:frataxin